MKPQAERAIVWWVIIIGLMLFWSAIMLLAWPKLGHAQTSAIQCQWDYGHEPDVKEFKLMYGVVSGTYTQSKTIPIADYIAPPGWIPVTINLSPGTYYFAVKAVDTGNNESGLSNEVSLSVPDIEPPGPCQNFKARIPIP